MCAVAKCSKFNILQTEGKNHKSFTEILYDIRFVLNEMWYNLKKLLEYCWRNSLGQWKYYKFNKVAYKIKLI